MSGASVLTDTRRDRKLGFGHPNMRAQHALVDPVLTGQYALNAASVALLRGDPRRAGDLVLEEVRGAEGGAEPMMGLKLCSVGLRGTSAPSRAKARATARPIPLSAPVMSAALSWSLPLPR